MLSMSLTGDAGELFRHGADTLIVPGWHISASAGFWGGRMTEEDADPGWVGLTEAIEALRDALVVRQARQLPVSLTHANPSTRLVPSNRTVIQQPPVIVTNGGIRDARIRGYSSIALDSSIIVRPHSADAATG